MTKAGLEVLEKAVAILRAIFLEPCGYLRPEIIRG